MRNKNEIKKWKTKNEYLYEKKMKKIEKRKLENEK